MSPEAEHASTTPTAAASQPASPGAAGPRTNPAYPRSVRILTVVLLADLLAFGLWNGPALREATWSAGSLILWGLAIASVYGVGWWILYSKTTLDGLTLTQTWIWTKRVAVHEVTQLKLVHWPGLQKIMAPRLLVRKRNGGMVWIHSADPDLLKTFCERVAQQTLPSQVRNS